MMKRIALGALALLFVFTFNLAASEDGTWVGWVTDTHCGAPKGDASKHSAGCVTKCVKDGASYALYTPADKKVYVIANADKVSEHAGHHVKVSGTLDGEKITVKSVEAAASTK